MTGFLKDSSGNKEATLRHNARYIYWYEEAERRQVSWDDWNDLVSLFQKEGREVPLVKGGRTIRALWAKDKSYRFDDDKKDPTLYTSTIDNKSEQQKLVVYFTYLDGDKANRPKGAGSAGFNLIKRWFLEEYGKDMGQVFGEIENIDGKTAFDKCVNSTKYAIYLRGSVKGAKLSGLWKGDISSAWPSEICEDLPDLPNHIIEKGRVAPNEKYPIAYYLKSGHIAEYNKYDTHELRQNQWYKDIEYQSKQNFKPKYKGDVWHTFEDVADEDEITVLVPYSKFTLRRQIERMYAIKEDKSDLFQSKWHKAMLNSFIGYMRSNEYNKQHYMGHISALAYARATNRMVQMAETLIKEGNCPIYMAIDSIMWVGKNSKLLAEKKELGAFVQEAAAAVGIIVNHGQYCLEKEGQIILERHQGIPDSIYLEKNISNLDEYITSMNKTTQEKVVYDRATHKFVLRRIMNV